MTNPRSYGARERGTARRFARLVWPSDRRGSVTVLVALSMTALLALLALGIDLGALFNARSEAQRAADAAALAGASAFLEYEADKARQPALDRALQFATSNEIRNQTVDPSGVSVWVDVNDATVRAAVRREGVPTWFARLFGIDAVDIGAEATAWAGAAGAAQCVKPFAVPDLWDESSDDWNRNRIWDEGERWRYDPTSGDRYASYSGTGTSTNETGYGSTWRNGRIDADGRRYERDYGRRITVKVTNPRDAYQPSFFLPWVLPADGGQSDCGPGSGGGNGGGGNGNGGVAGVAATATAGTATAVVAAVPVVAATVAATVAVPTRPTLQVTTARGGGSAGGRSGATWVPVTRLGLQDARPGTTVATVVATAVATERATVATAAPPVRGAGSHATTAAAAGPPATGRTSARATARSSTSTPST
jgi:hypothetical protein